MKHYKYYLLSLLVIAVDQVVKLLVHTHMELGLLGEIRVFGDWFKLHYVTNPGMAFGLVLGSEYGKLFLSLFRIVAMAGIAYYLLSMARRGVHAGLLWCTALILGGAIGNVIDSTFYGVLLHNAPEGSSTPWFHGQVVDMFYLDLWQGTLPAWLPLVGGQTTSLWPIFNVADASIFLGVAVILVCQRRFFADQHPTDARVADAPRDVNEPVA